MIQRARRNMSMYIRRLSTNQPINRTPSCGESFELVIVTRGFRDSVLYVISNSN